MNGIQHVTMMMAIVQYNGLFVTQQANAPHTHNFQSRKRKRRSFPLYHPIAVDDDNTSIVHGGGQRDCIVVYCIATSLSQL